MVRLIVGATCCVWASWGLRRRVTSQAGATGSLCQPATLRQKELGHACRQLLAECVHLVIGVDLGHHSLQAAAVFLWCLKPGPRRHAPR